ncbi:MAG TPA: toll/interleukin-1 receptor domain-containing protein [Longimicrobium sp.]
MPLPILQPASGPGAPSVAGVRVFLSYSHEDSRLVKGFVRHFELLAQSLGLDHRQVLFYDDRRLVAGEEYGDTLLDAIDEASLFVFLVSSNSLRADRYCMRMEVPRAARREVPIVPVVLSTCRWESQKVPGHPRGITFGDLSALPLNSKRQLRPVARWDSGDEAWYAVTEGLLPYLAKAAPTAPAPPPPAPALSPEAGVADIELLPYLCDQRPAVRVFDSGLGAWDTRALVVLVKGVYDDNPAQFWNRLRVQHLMDFLEVDSLRGGGLSPDRPLPLPASEDAGSPDDARQVLLHELSDALTGNRFKIRTVEALTAALQAMDGVIALLAMPDAPSAAALRGTLEVLLGLLGGIQDEAVRRRVVVAVTLEDPVLVDRKLADEWDLGRFAGTLVVELEPLCPVTRQDARSWHKQHQVRERFRVDEQGITALFPGEERLRLRHFHSGFHRLLGRSAP